METGYVHLYPGDGGCIQRYRGTDRHRAHARKGLAGISQVLARDGIER